MSRKICLMINSLLNILAICNITDYLVFYYSLVSFTPLKDKKKYDITITYREELTFNDLFLKYCIYYLYYLLTMRDSEKSRLLLRLNA